MSRQSLCQHMHYADLESKERDGHRTVWRQTARGRRNYSALRMGNGIEPAAAFGPTQV